MAYDEVLADRIRSVMAERDDVTEQKMFGGIAFLIGGRMAVGVIKQDLMVRVGPDAHADAVGMPHVRPMDFTGRPMRGFVYVAPAGVAGDPELRRWAGAGAAFAASQPPRNRR
jgi:TfoX/Sxy family transcriptional regulator of competence genes